MSLLLSFSFNVYAQEQNGIIKQFDIAHQKEVVKEPHQQRHAFLAIAVIAAANRNRDDSKNPKYNCRAWYDSRYQYGKKSRRGDLCLIWHRGRQLGFRSFLAK